MVFRLSILPSVLAILAISISAITLRASETSEKDALSDFLSIAGGEVPPPEQLHKFIKDVAMVKATPDLMPQEAQLGIFHFGETLIPKGRSPEAPFTDFRSPRSLVAFPVKPDGRILYIGYSPNENLLQFISEDEGTSPRMRFSEIHDYGKPTAKLNRDVEKTCISCHQYRRTIFPDPGWNETMENPRIYDAEVASKSFLDPFASDILADEMVRRQHDVRFNGVSPSFSDYNLENSANIYQDSVRDGLSRIQHEVFCGSICDGDFRCIRNLVSLEIAQTINLQTAQAKSLQDDVATSLEELYQDANPSADFGIIDRSNPLDEMLNLHLPQSSIPDRNPIDTQGNLVEFREGDVVVNADGHVPLGQSGKPISLSPKVVQDDERISLARPFLPMRCLAVNSDQKQALERKTFGAILNRINSLEMRNLLDQWPDNKDSLLSFILSDSEFHTLDKNSPLWNKRSQIVGSPSPLARTAVQTLKNVCSDCHQADSEKIPMYLPFDDLKSMKTFIGKATGKSPLYYVQLQLMPPPGSGDELTDTDRMAVVQALSGETDAFK